MNLLITPVLAELGSIEKMVITILAVAGGFLVGAVLTHILGHLTVRFVLKGESPDKLMRILRFVGGVAAAILVYLLLSGDGGFGLGGQGGGDAANRNKDTNKEDSTPQKKDPPKEDPKIEPKRIDKSDPNGQTVVVTVLRADSPKKLFFRLGDDGPPLTWEQVLEEIPKLSKDPKKPIGIVRIVPVKTANGEVDPKYSLQAATLLEAKLLEKGYETSRK